MKEEEEKLKKEALEKKKLKVTQKVLGDHSRIRSKVFDPQVSKLEDDSIQVPAALAGMTKKDFSNTSKSSTAAKKKIRRGASVSSLT